MQEVGEGQAAERIGDVAGIDGTGEVAGEVGVAKKLMPVKDTLVLASNVAPTGPGSSDKGIALPGASKAARAVVNIRALAANRPMALQKKTSYVWFVSEFTIWIGWVCSRFIDGKLEPAFGPRKIE